MQNKHLYSNQLTVGRRTYFFDIKTTKNNKKYLTITESKRLDKQDRFLRNNIMVFEEDIEKFESIITTVLNHFPTSSIKKTSRMDEVKSKYKNAYKPWTVDEDIWLEELFCNELKITEISKEMERNYGAITSRISKLGLKDKYPHLAF